MSERVDRLRGHERLSAATAVLQRARRADPAGGVWEAADLQWWWRRPRRTDEITLPVWFDDEGPAAASVLTDWGHAWQADALVVPNTVSLEVVWAAVLEAAAEHGGPTLEVLAREDDDRLLVLLEVSGFAGTDDRSGITWMSALDRPAVVAVPDGFRIVDRSEREATPHPMEPRNGPDVRRRLQECSLYDPSLDLSVETTGGGTAAYALFWFDPVTSVGMLEPMRVEDAYQRRGLGRALLTEGLERLTRAGASRLKVGFDGVAGRSLYLGAGFREAATLRAFRRAAI
jgi:predicted N-acetyltransferase YhbS